MRKACLTRSVRFSAAHRYYRSDWSEDRNRDVFGACSNPVGHGHNYRLEVTVEGAIAEDTGFAVDLGQLDAALRREVVDRLDHQHINHVIPDFGDGRLIPTSENIAAWLWPRIAGALPAAARLVRLRLHEDADLFVDYYGGSTPGNE